MPADVRRPRVLVLSPDFLPAHGGIQVLAGRVVEGLARFEPTVVTRDTVGSKAFDDAAPYRIVRTPTLSSTAWSLAALNALAVAEGLRLRPQVILNLHLACSPAAAVLAQAHRVSTALYLYAGEMVARPWLTRFALRSSRRIVAISEHTERMALDARGDPARIVRLAPGVDLPAGRRAERGGRPTLVTVARLTDRHKGHDVVLKAMVDLRRRVPDVQWVVVGDGPLRSELEAKAHADGLADCVRFVGAVDDAQRDAWLDRSHVFVMPSRLPPGGAGGEGFGIVFVEAGAHGLPVVAGSVAGVTDAVVHGETGLLVDPGDPGAVADALADLLLDPRRAARLGEAGAARARELAWPNVAAQVQDLLLELI